MEETDNIEESADEIAAENPQGNDGGSQELITIGDSELTLSEAQELLDKGRDYTKKTQELGERERGFREQESELHQWNTVKQALEDDPAAAIKMITDIAYADRPDLASVPKTQGQFSVELPEEAYENELALKSGIENGIAGLRDEIRREFQGQINQIKAALGDIAPLARGFAETQQTKADLAQIRAVHKVEITAEQLKIARDTTGIADPVKAYKYYQLENGASPTALRGKPPVTPGTQPVDVDDKNADSIFKNTMRGVVKN